MGSLTSPLQTRILGQLQQRFGNQSAVGQRLNEMEIAEALGVSRTPVRQVLRSLEKQGAVVYQPRRGFQLVRPLTPAEGTDADGEPIHLDERVLRDMALGNLSTVMSERSLMQRYSVPRGILVSTLRRLMRDQLVEPSPGRGWIFADVGAEALRDGYRFRQLLEPAAILADGYLLNSEALSALDQEHEAALANIEAMDRRTLFDLDAHFHRLIAEGAGTRHLIDAIERQNNIRRVNEYIGFIRLERISQSMQEHRRIIAVLLEGRVQVAAALMRIHLEISEEETFFHIKADLDALRVNPARSVLATRDR